MPKSYAITIQHTGDWSRRRTDVQTLHVTATTTDLIALLRLLDASPAVAKLSVCSTIVIPPLTKFATLTHNDLGIPEDSFEKMKK